MANADWLDLEHLAEVEITSEDPDHPIESALLSRRFGAARRWFGLRAAHAGEQTIRLVFTRPRRIRRIWLEFVEPSTERTQQFVLRWLADGETSFREIVRQQWNFSPHGATSETEDYNVDLQDVSRLELGIIPDTSGGDGEPRSRGCVLPSGVELQRWKSRGAIDRGFANEIVG